MGGFFSSLLTNGIWRYSEKLQIEGKGGVLSGLLRIVIVIVIVLDVVVFSAVIILHHFLGVNVFAFPVDIMIGSLIATGAFAISSSLYAIVRSFAEGLQDITLVLVASVSYGTIQLLVALVILNVVQDVVMIVGSIAGSLLITFGLIIVNILSKQPKPEPVSQEFRTLLTFSMPLAIRNTFTSAILTALIYLAFVFVDFSLSAIVSIGFSVIAIFTGAIRSVYTPYRQYAISSHEIAEDQQTCQSHIKQSSIIITEILLLGAFWLSILAPEVVLLLSTPQYLDAVEFVRISVVGIIILWIGYTYGSIGNYLAERTYLESVSAVIGFFVAIICAMLLVPTYGLLGIAYSYAISCIVIGCLNLLTGTISYGLLVPTKQLPAILLSLASSGLLFMVLNSICHIVIAGVAASFIFVLIQFPLGSLKLEYILLIFPFLKRFLRNVRDDETDCVES